MDPPPPGLWSLSSWGSPQDWAERMGSFSQAWLSLHVASSASRLLPLCVWGQVPSVSGLYPPPVHLERRYACEPFCASLLREALSQCGH